MGSLAGVPRSGMQMAAWGIGFLDWNAKWVVGYPGTSQLAIALERGEIDMNSTSNLFVTQQLLNTGKFNILVQTGDREERRGRRPRRIRQCADHLDSLMEGKLKTPVEKQAFNYWAAITALDKWVALPPGTPQPIIDTLSRDLQKGLHRSGIRRRWARRSARTSSRWHGTTSRS